MTAPMPDRRTEIVDLAEVRKAAAECDDFAQSFDSDMTEKARDLLWKCADEIEALRSQVDDQQCEIREVRGALAIAASANEAAEQRAAAAEAILAKVRAARRIGGWRITDLNRALGITAESEAAKQPKDGE